MHFAPARVLPVFIALPGVFKWLAIVQGLQDSQLIDVFLDQGSKLAHDVPTLAARQAARPTQI